MLENIRDKHCLSTMEIDLSTARVLVIGDIMLDRYYRGYTDKISNESPIPVVNVQIIDDHAGGAANVALNISRMNGKVGLCGFVGNDEPANVLSRLMKEAAVDRHFIYSKSSPTITKIRILSQRKESHKAGESNSQSMLRLDFEDDISDEDTNRLVKKTSQIIDQYNVVILSLSDCSKGVIKQSKALISLAKSKNIPIIVDPKFDKIDIFEGATILKPNLKEFEIMVGSFSTEDALLEKAHRLVSECSLDGLLLTRDIDGMTLVLSDGVVKTIPSVAKDVVDVNGAGDTVIAVMAMALSCGYSFYEAMILANNAAGVVVNKRGTATASVNELISFLGDEIKKLPNVEELRKRRGVISSEINHHQCEDNIEVTKIIQPPAGSVVNGIHDETFYNNTKKIVTIPNLQDAVKECRERNEKIVMTNGCFDIFHVGHVMCLQKAQSLGDRLIVAVNSDASVRRLKGETRPVIGLQSRMEVLAGLECVDWVVCFEQDTPLEIIKTISPDVLVKGGEYKEDEVVGSKEVKKAGGRVVTIAMLPNMSSSKIIDHIISIPFEKVS